LNYTTNENFVTALYCSNTEFPHNVFFSSYLHSVPSSWCSGDIPSWKWKSQPHIPFVWIKSLPNNHHLSSYQELQVQQFKSILGKLLRLSMSIHIFLWDQVEKTMGTQFRTKSIMSILVFQGLLNYWLDITDGCQTST